MSRNDFDYSRFKDLVQALPAAIDAEDAIIDGEIVVLDEQGESRFYDLMFNRGTPIFAAFDILWLDGEDLRDLQLWERKSIYTLRGEVCVSGDCISRTVTFEVVP